MHEIIFYNGFNLLVDIIIGGAVFFFTSRAYWFKGYSEGYADSQKGHDYENAR
jgi:hypothetical protein